MLSKGQCLFSRRPPPHSQHFPQRGTQSIQSEGQALGRYRGTSWDRMHWPVRRSSVFAGLCGPITRQVTHMGPITHVRSHTCDPLYMSDHTGPAQGGGKKKPRNQKTQNLREVTEQHAMILTHVCLGNFWWCYLIYLLLYFSEFIVRSILSLVNFEVNS